MLNFPNLSAFLGHHLLKHYPFSTGYLDQEEMEQGLAEQLMPSYEDDRTSQGGRLSAPSTLRPASSVVSAYRLLTPSVKVRRVTICLLDIALIDHQTLYH